MINASSWLVVLVVPPPAIKIVYLAAFCGQKKIMSAETSLPDTLGCLDVAVVVALPGLAARDFHI